MFKRKKQEYSFKLLQKREKRKPSNLEKYVLIVTTVVLSFSLIFVVSAFAYVRTHINNNTYSKDKQMERIIGVEPAETETPPQEKKPLKENFLVVGVDDEAGLTDSIMVMGFDSAENKISVISIPRDTYIKLSKEKVKTLRENGRSVPYDGSMKINAINSYGGKEYGMLYLEQQLEEMLNLNIHYYAKVNTEAFRKIVDRIGGVWFEVPEGGLHYTDPFQDLRIDLKGGYQLLDGDNAEGLVRFRSGYASQDLMRMEVQQQFLKEFVKQLLQKDTLVKNAPGLLKDCLSYVETNFGLLDAMPYIPYLDTLDTENITTATLPGEPAYYDGISYFVHDKSLTKKLVLQLFYSIEEPNPEMYETGANEQDDLITQYKTPQVNHNNQGQDAGKPKTSGREDGKNEETPDSSDDSQAEQTNEPGATGEPDTTNEPGATDEPGTTNEPGATGIPGATNEPGATGEPDITNEPGATGEPGITNEPGATGEPGTTNEPGATGTPDATNEPGAEAEPNAANPPASTGDGAADTAAESVATNGPNGASATNGSDVADTGANGTPVNPPAQEPAGSVTPPQANEEITRSVEPEPPAETAVTDPQTPEGLAVPPLTETEPVRSAPETIQ